MSGTTIYTKVFSELDIEAFEKEMNEELLPEFEDKFETGEVFLKYVSENSEYEENPLRMEWKESYIEKIVKFSNLVEADVTIKEVVGSLDITLQLPISSYMGFLKNELSEIFLLSDDISFFSNENNPSCVTIGLTYYTPKDILQERKHDFNYILDGYSTNRATIFFNMQIVHNHRLHHPEQFLLHDHSLLL